MESPNDDGNEAALSHVTADGAAHMVDVSDKPSTARVAEARGSITMLPETLRLIGTNAAQKGDVLGVARIAGVMAAKRTADLIPLCHPLALNAIDIDFDIDSSSTRIFISARTRTTGPTGVEMEALTAVAVAALTIYDMCKAVDRGMVIGGIQLGYKEGGKSGVYRSRGPVD